MHKNVRSRRKICKLIALLRRKSLIWLNRENRLNNAIFLQLIQPIRNFFSFSNVL